LAGGSFRADDIESIPVGRDGLANLMRLETRLAELAEIDGKFAPATVAMQLANSETGVIQPVRDASMIADRYGACFICDAVAALGKIPVRLADINADAIVLSAHKFGGPKGAGAIVLNGDHLFLNEPLLKGGGQEMRLRSGTENVAGIVGMGAAAEEAVAQIPAESRRMSSMRDRLLEGFRAQRPDLAVFGENAPRLPNTVNIAAPGLKAETAVIAFDLAAVSISSGSACSSGKVRRSHVLDAMGVAPELAECALRFSLGWTTTENDIATALDAFARIVANARRAAA
jgi:cysteine desulfurase